MISSDEQAHSPRLIDLVLKVAAAAGLVLIVVGLIWSNIMPTQVFWSQEKAEEFEIAAVKLHEQSHSDEGTREEQERQMHLARREFEQIKQNLEMARHARDHGGRYLSLCGSLLLVGSALGLYFRRQHSG